MTILDRYIIRLFLMNFVILFFVVIGLIIMLDLITNGDEFVQAWQVQDVGEAGWIERAKGTGLIAFHFYWPRIFMFYNYLVGLLPLGAGAFTFTAMMRNRELIAILAGGIGIRRIAMPVLFLGFGANLLMIGNQEFVIPKVVHQLNSSHSDIKRGGVNDIEIQFMDDGAGALFTAEVFRPDINSNTIIGLTILEREPIEGETYFGATRKKITAEQAIWNEERAGWNLANGIMQRRTKDQAGFYHFEEPEALTFYPSNLTPTTILLREQKRFQQFLSLRELSKLITLGQETSVIDVTGLRQVRHGRFSAVVVNMLILVMGLPFFMKRVPQPMFGPALTAAGLCVGAWGGSFMVGAATITILPPAAVAWMPLAMYLPVAYYMVDTIES